jgi:hypothetical protein
MFTVMFQLVTDVIDKPKFATFLRERRAEV